MTVFLPDAKIEKSATHLLGRYESVFSKVTEPPVPVEHILEDVLDLKILWDEIPEREGQSILAALQPFDDIVVFNEKRRGLIDETDGLYQTILAHESGHWVLHAKPWLRSQQHLPQIGSPHAFIYRKSQTQQNPQEIQAHKFMSFLLMPSNMLFDAFHNIDRLTWPSLYALRKQFQVTITALTVRLQSHNLLYVDDKGQLYRSREEYFGQRGLFE